MEENKRYLTKVCVHPTTFEEFPWRTDIPSQEELAKEDFHITVLKDFKISYATVTDGYIKLGTKDVSFEELDGWFPGYQCTQKMRLSDNAPKDVRLWTHEFYQRDPDNISYDFYRSQRPAIVVLQEERQIKGGLFSARVVSIEPEDSFRVRGVGGGCHHNYYIGEEFWLRKHKSVAASIYWHSWFDVRRPGQDFAEEFRLISEEN